MAGALPTTSARQCWWHCGSVWRAAPLARSDEFPSSSAGAAPAARRAFAAKPAKGAKGAAAATAKLDLKGDMAVAEARGVSLKKAGADPPLSKRRSDYPAWLWGLLGPRPTLQDLQKRIASAPGGVRGISESDYLRYRKLKRRVLIKANNSDE